MNERVERGGCGAVRDCGAGGAPARGVTLIELIVVITIIAFVAMAFISGLIRYQSRYKVTAAVNMIDSTLHYARNLAIANNAIYHVRFENVFETIPSDPSQTPPASRTPLDHQSIGIYCFPNMTEAMTIAEESQAKWNEYRALTTPAGITHDNYLINRTVFPQGAYVGFHYTGNVSPPYDRVLYFMPDGTMYFSPDGTTRMGAMIFVTDNDDFADNRSLSASDYATLQWNRRDFFNKHTPPATSGYTTPTTTSPPSCSKPTGVVRMLTVYMGGMIKVLPAGSSL
ncbi:MAG TPA: prepilin-type N-terminal cleavage/methylation domain-containing protein [Planctomycetota bacterium]|nr:prepilin-type N-terminal cleavage/methylation domain-containing protein [Planctomycetota bacterium]